MFVGIDSHAFEYKPRGNKTKALNHCLVLTESKIEELGITLHEVRPIVTAKPMKANASNFTPRALSIAVMLIPSHIRKAQRLQTM